MASLFVIQGPDQGKRFEATSASAIIGRDASNTVRLCDAEVSRKHAELRLAPRSPRASGSNQNNGEGYRIVDLGSANGTYVNSQQITEAVLRSGDHIRIGQTLLLYNDSGTRADVDLRSRVEFSPRSGSAIVKSVPAGEGSRVLQTPDLTSDWLQSRLGNLTTVYQTTLAITSIVDLDMMLDQVLQLAFDAVAADRGSILLSRTPGVGGSENLEPRAMRWRGSIQPEDRLSISKTIVDHVLSLGHGLIVSDVSEDQRFARAPSVVDFGIREAICVPIQGRHAIFGVLYVDARSSVDASEKLTSTTQGKFRKDHLTLLAAIGHQAGLAVENTQLQQAKLEAERLAAVGQTIATLSHHIKNILQGMRGGGYLVRMGIDNKDEAALQRGWSIVEKNQQKVYDLVMDMLSYSKEREPSLDLNNLNQVVADVVELMNPRAAELHISLDCQPAQGLIPFLFDEEGIHRAVLNLVSNAIDAVEHVDQAQIQVRVSHQNLQAKIEVIDNGPGIPDLERDSLFKLFASTKGSRGTGLGLPVSEKIVREHGGSIEVHSQVGKGTRFAIILPMKSSEDHETTMGSLNL